MEIVTYLNSIFWGWLVAGILLSCGIFYTLRLGFPQIRYFTKLIHNLQTASVNNKGVSAFGALCSAIGSEVGAGSLVGVATALASGGPRAISCLPMLQKTVQNSLYSPNCPFPAIPLV